MNGTSRSSPNALADPVAAEINYFDTYVDEKGDFNPFTERGWKTLQKRFERWVADPLVGQVPADEVRILEVGCGTGRSRRIYERFLKFHVGLDLSDRAVQVAAERFHDSRWMRADACRLPFADESFDIVAFSSVLHHIPDYQPAISEALRVLKPGGYAFAYDPNVLHPAMALFRWPGSKFYLAAGVSPNERPLQARRLRRQFRDAGFQYVHLRCQGDIPYRKVAPGLINAMLGAYNAMDFVWERVGLGRRFGTFIITAARKAPLPGAAAITDAPPPRYSVVVPVYNEGPNIATYCKKAVESLPPGYELLICYDFDEDNTLPALAALPADQKPSRIRLVRNRLGQGVRYAIEAGMSAAAAPVVVVMMADVSDDFSAVEEMVRRAEAGAAIVCASRYMKGGHQVGGPKIKGFLSRVAGLTLHWFTGLSTHDPTNSFKAYRLDFLRKTPIESKAGFCLGLELTVKAHFRGGRVEEVPATWLDRTAGQSRFRLVKWLPKYLHWYFWAFRHRWLG
jgi:dolichol-phosphate mannosyltransferase